MTVSYLDYLANNRVLIYPIMGNYLTEKIEKDIKTIKKNDKGELFTYYGAKPDCYAFEVIKYLKGNGFQTIQYDIDDYSVGDFDPDWIKIIYDNLMTVDPVVAGYYYKSAKVMLDRVMDQRKRAEKEKHDGVVSAAEEMIAKADKEYEVQSCWISTKREEYEKKLDNMVLDVPTM